MVKPYSLDLRERVVAAVAAGESCRAAAERFDVSVSSVVKWVQRQRATGSAAALAMGGRRPFALAGERDQIEVGARGAARLRRRAPAPAAARPARPGEA